jgi:hypothetical protein
MKTDKKVRTKVRYICIKCHKVMGEKFELIPYMSWVSSCIHSNTPSKDVVVAYGVCDNCLRRR